MKIKTVGELKEFLKTQPDDKPIIGLIEGGDTTGDGTWIDNFHQSSINLSCDDLETRINFTLCKLA